MKNRYGDEYHWEKLNDKEYKFVMEGESMDYCLYGGKEGQQEIDVNDLGMFDPSGGPYVAIGSLVEGKAIEHIRRAEEGFIVTVRNC
jgi:hypothetical protein